MRSLLLRWAVLAVSIAVVAALSERISVDGGAWGYLWVAAVFGVVNALIRPVVSMFALPITVLTLGLFSLVVNGAMLLLTAALTDALEIDGFGVAILAALGISLLSSVLNRMVLSD